MHEILHVRSSCPASCRLLNSNCKAAGGIGFVRSLFGITKRCRCSLARAFQGQRQPLARRQRAPAAAVCAFPDCIVGEDLGWPCDFADYYQLHKLIGEGNYGCVWIATCQLTGEQVAVKVIRKERPGCTKEQVLQSVRDEVVYWERCQQSHYVVRLLGKFEDAGNCYLVQELCSGGDLKELLEGQGPLSEVEAALVMRGVLDVMVECHRQGVCFGDIKPANFVLKRPVDSLCPVEPATQYSFAVDASSICGLEIKAVDFGCSQHFTEASPSRRKRVGTPAYMAPEMFSSVYCPRVDVWGAGVLLYQLLSNKLPFWNQPLSELRKSAPHEIMCGILSNPILLGGDTWSHVSAEAKDLIRRMLDRDPSKRLSAGCALQHPWFHKQLGFTPLPSSGGPAACER